MLNDAEPVEDDNTVEWSFVRAVELLDDDAEITEMGPALGAAAQELEFLQEIAVRRARQRRESWPTIGAALGVSRQAAQKRYGYLDESL